MARPYGLMLIYVVPILFVIILRASESRAKLPNRLVFAAFLALVIDFAMTLAFAGQRSLTIY